MQRKEKPAIGEGLGGRDGRRGERGESGERGKGKESLRELGEIPLAEIDKSLIPSIPQDRPRRDLPITPNWATRSPPILHSYSSFLVRHIEIFPLPSPPISTNPPLRSLPPLELFRPLVMQQSPSYLCSLLSHPSFPPTDHTRMRLFPHVVLIIYTFSISRLFFSQLSDQTGEAFISPLIHLYARRCVRHFPGCYLSLIPSELDPAKISLGARPARLFLIITSIPQRNAGIHKPTPYLAHAGYNHHRISSVKQNQRNRS